MVKISGIPSFFSHIILDLQNIMAKFASYKTLTESRTITTPSKRLKHNEENMINKKTNYAVGAIILLSGLVSCSGSNKGADSAAQAAKNESIHAALEAQAAESAEAEKADSIAAAQDLEKAFAEQEKLAHELFKYVLGLSNNTSKCEAFLKANSTAEFQKALKNANEYDDGGYAVWALRTGAQDGDGASTILGVEPDGPDCVTVKYKDMGQSGSTKLKFVKEGDAWKISGADSKGNQKINWR